MFDETRMNPELTDDQFAVESSLRSIMLPASAIDSETIMYQAGWAAAMHQCRESANASGGSRIWSALAMTFAATTAACLMFIFSMPPLDSGAGAVATVAVPESRRDDSSQPVEVEKIADVEIVQANKGSQSRLSVSSLFGLSSNGIVSAHNARIQHYLSEAASPSHFVSHGSKFDLDLEPVTPLTPRSIRSSSL